MYELTDGKRGYTKDIDLDFIKYPITPEGITFFIQDLGKTEIYNDIGIEIVSTKPLNQADYSGTRVELEFNDSNDSFFLFIDVGVHLQGTSIPSTVDYELKLSNTSAIIPIDSNNLSIYEKISTFAKFGTDNERIHDIFDLYWRLNYIDYDIKKVLQILDERLVYSGIFKNRNIIKKRLINTFENGKYRKEIKLEHNWTGTNVDDICELCVKFVKNNF